MGIQSDDFGINPGSATQTAAPAAVPQQKPVAQATAATANDGKQKNWTFQDRAPFGTSPLSRGVNNEYLVNLRDTLAKKFEGAPPMYKYSFISIDRTTDTQLHFSALVFCMVETGNESKAVAFHTLILEASNLPITPLFKPSGMGGDNGQVEIFRPSSDAFDSELMKLVSARVRAEFPNVKQLSTMATVVPRAFNVKDANLVHQLALQLSQANSTEFDVNRPDFTDINLAYLVNDSRLTITPTYSKQTLADAVDNPIRADITIGFNSKRNSIQSDQSVNAGENNTPISQLSGFVDFLYYPAQMNSGGIAGYAQPNLRPGEVATQAYAAVLNITEVQNYFVTTLPGFLLSLVTAFAASENGNWMQSFLASSRLIGGKPFLMHDIGGLAIETIGGGKPINTTTATFLPEDLGRMMGQLVYPGLTIALDVPDCSPDSWALKVFSAASQDQMPAIDAIVNAANYLTNGHFGRHFNKQMAMFVNKMNRVHLGYYTSQAGERRDIRDIDYLAVANTVGENDPRIIREWSDTFAQTSLPLAPRLAARKKIITNIQGTAEITGFAHRVTFSAQFMTALAMACRDAGFSPTLSNQYGTAGMQNQRGVNNFVPEAALGLNNNVFASGFSGYSGPSTFGYNGNRW